MHDRDRPNHILGSAQKERAALEEQKTKDRIIEKRIGLKAHFPQYHRLVQYGPKTEGTHGQSQFDRAGKQ